MSKYQYLFKDKLIQAFPIAFNKNACFFPAESEYEGSEYEDVKFFLNGKKWTDLNRKVFASYVGDEKAILAFLSPAGFFYYMPAFLSAGIEVVDSDPDFTNAVVFYLSPECSDSLNQRERLLFGLFNKSQVQVISEWVQCVKKIMEVEHHPVDLDKAIGFWASIDQEIDK